MDGAPDSDAERHVAGVRARLAGLARLCDAGCWPHGRAPFGYRRRGDTGGNSIDKNTLVIVENEAEVVRRAFTLCASGAMVAEIVRSIGRKPTVVVDMLHNRVYLGQARDSRGGWIAGRHEALVSHTVFDRALAVLAAHERLEGRHLARARLRDAGYWPVSPPFAYRRLTKAGRSVEERNTLIVDEVKARVVRHAFERCAAGATIDQVARSIGRTFNFAFRLLHGRVYVGEVCDTRNRWIRGRHEPIVSRELFDRVQAVIAARNRQKASAGDWPRSRAVGP